MGDEEGTKLLNNPLDDVAATSLITLVACALESQTEKPILNDPKAIEITQKLRPEMSKSDNKTFQILAEGKVDKNLVVHIAMRAKRYDQYAQDFLKESPTGIVVNIGCGLDTRFSRIDDGQVEMYDLDFPEIIDLKKNFLTENSRYHFIASSALDDDRMEIFAHVENRPILFLAEGVFMYLQPHEVKSLVLALQANFPGAELVCEMFNSFWLNKSTKWMIEAKLQRGLNLGKDATFRFGIRAGQDLEQWNDGIEFLDEWSYMDEPEQKLGALRFFRRINLLRKTLWTVHYRLNRAAQLD